MNSQKLAVAEAQETIERFTAKLQFSKAFLAKYPNDAIQQQLVADYESLIARCSNFIKAVS